MDPNTPLAIVGYAYRAPGVERKGLWEFLADAKSAFSEIPSDRFNKDAFRHISGKAGFFPSEGGHFLPDDVYAFDASFFNIKAEEARSLDPSTRLMLECAFEAAESAGLTLPELAGANIGVFAQATFSDYSMRLMEDLQTANKYAGLGISQSLVANRLSYFFGLTGPSVSVDAACAGTTYALHQACQSVRAGDCSAALVGAASIISGPEMWVALAALGALSPEGKSFSYDSRAAGFGRGEGGGCLIIKPLSDAIARGDPVRAVIRGTACNHSGRSKGITMPSQAAQERLLVKLHDSLGLNPRDTTFVEGHGTGTQAGDPIDAGAIAAVVAKESSSASPTYLGHLEGASGLVSVVKAIMMLEQECLLPNANFEKFNPSIVDDGRLKVLMKPLPWPPGAKKRVCVTNFGFGGSNAAVLLEQAPRAQTNGIFKPLVNGISLHAGGLVNGDIPSDGTPSNGDPAEAVSKDKLFVISAKSSASLEAYVSSVADYLEYQPTSPQFLQDLSYTLGQRRTHFPRHRIAVSADSLGSLLEQLKSTPPNTKSVETLDGTVAFIFTGQGAQYFQMAAGLEKYEAFSDAIERAESFLAKLGAPWSLAEELAKPQGESRIDDAEISQPVCTAIQLAVISLLQSWGVSPAAVVGHSSGEIAAAYAAKLISFEAAIAISYFRGVSVNDLIFEGLEQGAMLAIGASAEEATKLIQDEEGYTTIAAVNSHNSVTLSGDIDAIENIQEKCQERDIFARRLKVDIAYHSRHMEAASASYLASIEPFCLSSRESPERESSTKLTFISSVTGKQEYANTVDDASYWVKNLIGTVQFLSALERLYSLDVSAEEKRDAPQARRLLSIEIGPHSALKNPTMQTMNVLSTKNGQEGTKVAYLPSLIRGKPAPTALLDLAGKLFVSGHDIDLGEVNQTKPLSAKVVTDLPPYEWNKASRYIHQPRITAQKMLGGEAHSALLGSKSPYAEGNEHVYRNVFTLDDLPWIRDHNIAGDVLFPFTGFFSLAVEAFRRVHDASTPVQNVLVREFHVTRGLRIKEDEQVDLTTKMRPADMGTELTSTTTWAFEVMSWSSAHGWTVHCRGLVERDHGETFTQSPAVQAAAILLGQQDTQALDHKAEYAFQRQNGVVYGPTFLNTIDMRRLPGAIIHTIQLRDIEKALSQQGTSVVTVDPPTLDSFFQTIGTIQELEGPRPVHVPTHTHRWRISNSIAADAGHQYTIVSRRLSHDTKSGNLHLSFVVFDLSSGSPQPVMEVDDMALKTITQLSDESLTEGLPKTYFTRHVPHVDFIDGLVLANAIKLPPAEVEELQSRRDFNEVSIVFLRRMVESFAESDASILPSHLSKFLAWAQRLAAATEPLTNAAGELLCAVGLKLPEILRAEIEPLEIMLEDGLLMRYYEQDPASKRSTEALAKYVGLLHDCKPDIRILEIGGGTGSATLPVLEAIEETLAGASANFQYTFTDISAGFFENAKTKLGHRWSRNITYQKLDISQDPLSQGFAAEDYDLIIAANVLHATSDIVQTIQNTCALLKPGGKLALLELTRPSLPLAFPFAALPGWWLSEDAYRSIDGPLLTKESWRALLEANEFSGIEGHVEDYPGEPEQFLTTMWSTKKSPAAAGPDERFHICQVSSSGQCENVFADLISQELVESTVSSLLELDVDSKTYCIFVDDPEHSVFSDPSPEQFAVLQKALTESAAHVLWVIPANAHPDASFVKGFLRTLRIEDDSKAFVLLEDATFDRAGLEAIIQLARRLNDPSILDEQEYSIVDGLIHAPRFCPHEPAAQTFAMEAGVSVRKEQSLWSAGEQAFEMTVDAVGSPDSIFFRDNTKDVFEQPLGGKEVIIQVGAIGVSFRDLLLVLGSLPWHPPGMEGAGVVTRTGPEVSDLQIGDRVFYTITQAGMTNYVRTPSSQVYKIPEELSLEDAASMPIAYCTALLSLVDTAHIQRGETVLIHAATGALGQACIMLAQHLGARVFATAGTPEKREFLTKTFGIPADHIFSSRNAEFRSSILLATDNKGVDVIVNSLSGALLRESWELIAPHGRFIELGKKDLFQNSNLAMRPFLQNASFHSLDVRMIEAARPGAVRGWLSEIVALYQSGAIRPIQLVTQVPISQMAAGLRKLQSGHNIGKVVLTLGADEKVLTERSSPLALPASTTSSPTLLSPDATYLITGGTGGIGRSLAEWMAKQGARHIVILGRSGSSNPKVAELLSKYEGTGVCMRAIACDVGFRDSLLRMKEELEDLPPVLGVVHGALYLRDAMFLNSTFEDYQNITRPKMQAAWLLDELFPNLDFFVSLSSIDSIIGHFGQSIYAGSSTFLDAFSEHRVKQGKPAVSISLPVVEGVGYVADRVSVKRGYTPLSKGAIIGPASGLNVNGRSFSFVSTPTAAEKLPWGHFHPLRAIRPLQQSSGEADRAQATGGADANGQRGADTSPEALMEALRTKVSNVTMLDRDEITPERNLAHYGLDSLVSVELRNWIRREYGADLALKDIVAARHLNALSKEILSQIK
ncbi:Highly reducing polyketide synthase ACRTS2 [Apiospora rasikravindrae]|uniref:Highly reducing polyketide synthase ACRTS2 n=1 Tax=Apiospora rasikravindrae TaxID=990691 RepID=A0ABR1S098_9PEZI